MKSRHALRILAGITLVSLTAVGCSSSDNGASVQPGTANSSAATDGAGADTATSDAAPATDGAPVTDGAPSTAGAGEIDPSNNCHVDVTGAVTASWDSPGGYSAIGYGPWIPAGSAGSAPIALDETFFILNCTGTGNNYVGFGPNDLAAIPMTPATYPILPADNAFGGTDAAHVMDVLLGLDGTDTNWGPSAEGTLVITEFDNEHIAGTFSIPITDVLAHLTGTSKGDALVTGTFYYSNPNI
ncbi:MAG: hypothetical protein ABMA25_21885 [Ilumatobacteraceae bacterium]